VNATELKARRATIDDLPALQDLWREAGLPWEDLEKFVTEFQVVPDEEGALLGAVGLQVDGTEGLLHSEAIRTGDQADDVRQLLWARIQIVGRNLGVGRVWTLEDAAYWRSAFRVATSEETQKLKATFADAGSIWWIHPLVDAARAEKLAAEHMIRWMEMRGEEKGQMESTIRNVRILAWIVVALVAAGALALVVFLVMHAPELTGKIRGPR